MIKVKWLKAHWRYAYSKGDIGFVTPKEAELLLKGGFVFPIPEEEGNNEKKTNQENPPKDLVNNLPEDFPARTKLFTAGYNDMTKVKNAGDLILDIGLGKSTLTKIKGYLEKYVFGDQK